MSGAMRASERMSIYGSDQLNDAELLSVACGCTEEIAKAVLVHCGGSHGLATRTVAEVCEVKGAGPKLAARMIAAVHLGRRALMGSRPWADRVRKPREVADLCRARIGHETQECFVVIGLDTRQSVRLFRIVARGSVSQVDVHPREVFRPLVRDGLHSAIVAHNHPSGDVEPSPADIGLTNRLRKAADLVGIPLIDHLVVTQHDYVSFAERGLM